MSGRATGFLPFQTCFEASPRLLMFTGKGGVGKTTCAAAAAVALAGRGKETLLLSTDPAHSVADSLGVPLGPQPRQVPGVPRLSAVEIDARGALDQFKSRFGEALFDLLVSTTYLSEEDARAMMHLELPGLDELMGLHQVLEFLSGESPRYEHLVWDSAPTGHTLRLLELPELIDHWVRALAEIQWKYRDLLLPPAPDAVEEGDLLLTLKRTIRYFNGAMRDPGRSRLVPVTIPEPMAGAETLRLVERLRSLKIPVQFAVINGLHQGAPGCRFCTARSRAHQAYAAELAGRLQGLRLIAVAALPDPVRGVDRLRTISRP